ncbi:hypothetical protein B0T26DRAFT_876154 [Lasiosphaeria miniovina]|uniref:Uncharacterized protein n=1 Tax=Lasiosphaeria miniovina TaxID=1954250 RepID=A0AA39ZSV3_9PEZI|nr:uncharacterized protein B0T26DRAFT_876154 [Lasiosphaeria miniovina]KAK0702960.1 hypothetical protein B0T26DRAFT_876154 [Lasiosphaeria miniovina]
MFSSASRRRSSLPRLSLIASAISRASARARSSAIARLTASAWARRARETSSILNTTGCLCRNLWLVRGSNRLSQHTSQSFLLSGVLSMTGCPWGNLRSVRGNEGLLQDAPPRWHPGYNWMRVVPRPVVRAGCRFDFVPQETRKYGQPAWPFLGLRSSRHCHHRHWRNETGPSRGGTSGLWRIPDCWNTYSFWLIRGRQKIGDEW